MTLDLTAVDAVLAAGWVPAAQAILTVIVSTVGLRIALNWTGSAMRRARCDTGTQIRVNRGLVVVGIVVPRLFVLGVLGVRPPGLGAVAGERLLVEGAVGAGKTTLVQGLAEGLDVPTPVSSPSFVIENQYRGRLVLYHVDLYRLERVEPELWQSLEEHLYGDGVTAVEWAERLPDALHDGGTVLRFEPNEAGPRVTPAPPESRP